MAKPKTKKTEKVELNSRDKFIEDFSTLHGAAVGVIAVRTREPSRVIDALYEFSQDRKWQFNVWKCTDGWNKFDMQNPETQPSVDNEVSQVGAVKKIGTNEMMPDNSKVTKDEDRLKGSLFAMMWPHWFVNRNDAIPEVVAYLYQYAKSFSGEMKRLVMIVPPEYNLPIELEDSVIIVDTELPAQDELLEVYEDMVAYIEENGRSVDYDEDEVKRILAAAAGMTLQEFENALSRAFRTFRKELPDVPIDDFVSLISKTKAELIKRSEVLELMPLGSMKDVGGLENLKEWVDVRKHAYEPEAREFGVDKPKGVALIGPPGTGKSLSAKAIAHVLGLPLIRFDVSRVFNQFVGSSEGRVREALKLCAAMSPCVVMLDEVDKAFDMNSGGGDSGVGKRVLGAVLTFMQESEKDILWVMTANRVGGLPPELLRKGRLDEVFSVTLPNESEREAILNIHLTKRKQDIKTIDVKKVAEGCSGFVGAEIESAVAEAVLLAYAKDEDVTAELIIEQFQNTKPLSVAHKATFEAMQTWAEDNARPSSKGTPVRNRERDRQGTAVKSKPRRIDTGDLDG